MEEKDPKQIGEEDEEEEEEEEDVSHLQMPSDEEDVKHSIKKIKIERVVSNYIIFLKVYFNNIYYYIY